MENKNPIKHIKPLGFPWATQDPFLFCVHHHDIYPKGKPDMSPDAPLTGRNLGNDFTPKDGWRMYHGQTVPGFPVHPHRGFETITAVQQGLIDHADSLGAAGRFGNGDVQWMTAGKGVQHAEMFPLLKEDEKNIFNFFQIWLNLPARSKMATPHFQMHWSEDVPEIHENGVHLRLIAGSYKEKTAQKPAPESWASDPNNQVNIWIVELDSNAKWDLPIASPEVNRTLYFYEGEDIDLSGKKLNTGVSIDLYADQETTLQNGNTPSKFLLLQGKPINEPIAQYGPFVMNNYDEIQQTMEDYRKTQFGGWPWPKHEQVHDKMESRFALYPDGKKESKPI